MVRKAMPRQVARIKAVIVGKILHMKWRHAKLVQSCETWKDGVEDKFFHMR